MDGERSGGRGEDNDLEKINNKTTRKITKTTKKTLNKILGQDDDSHRPLFLFSRDSTEEGE